MPYVNKHITLLLSSDETNGASNKTSDGSEFTVFLDDENIVIPEKAVECNLWVLDAEYFFTFPNILTGVNDLITVTYLDGVNPLFTMNLVVDQGLYGITDLNNKLEILQFNYAGFPEPSPLFELVGDDATQKALIKYNYAGVRVDLTGAQTFRDLIGFDGGLYPTAGVSAANTFDSAQTSAEFNTLKYVLFSCDLCDNGFANNVKYDYYIARSLITAGIGEQVVYSPTLKMMLPANNLIGKKLSRTRVKLLDDKGNDVNTNNEVYSIHVVIEYVVEVE